MTWEQFAADRAKMESEVERLRAALEREQREHGTCEDVNAQRFQTLTDTIIALTQQVTAMRPIVEALTWDDDADEDEFMTCSLCGGENVIGSNYEHAADCPVIQARAYVAAHPARGEGRGGVVR